MDVRVRSSERRFSQAASARSPASVTWVRASSASTINAATGASFASAVSSQRRGALAVRKIKPSVARCDRGTSFTPSSFSSAAMAAA
jgi:hypothetical protein